MKLVRDFWAKAEGKANELGTETVSMHDDMRIS